MPLKKFEDFSTVSVIQFGEIGSTKTVWERLPRRNLQSR